jgi:hypothetical protein
MARLGLALDFPESFRIFPLNLRRAVWVLAVVACAAMGAATAEARGPKLAKYPLRFHVLAADAGHRMQKMSPGEAVACDAVDDMLASADPGQEAPFALTGVSSDPCALHASSSPGAIGVCVAAGAMEEAGRDAGGAGSVRRYSGARAGGGAGAVLVQGDVA